MIQSVAIIGSGQVGTSIAAALTREAPHIRISMTDIDAATPDLVRQQFGILKLPSDRIHFVETAREAAASSDLVILATPISAMAATVKEIRDSVGIGTIITDTGSAKAVAMASITEALAGTGIQYVPAHPGNGSQGSGPKTGVPGNILGPNSWMFLIETPDHKAGLSGAHGLVESFWKSAGVQVTTTDVATHDRFFGACSHLEHLLVFTYLNMAQEDTGMRSSFTKAGTSFRNLTRVAIRSEGGSPTALVDMWQPIFEQNRGPIEEACTNFQHHLSRIVDAVERKDEAALDAIFSEAHTFRASITDNEPRESLAGEDFDSRAGELPAGLPNANNIRNNLLLPIAIACAQTLNARDIDPELVRGKANPSFRDGTALMLNEPERLTDVVIGNRNAFLELADIFSTDLQAGMAAIQGNDWDKVKADIASAQEIRTPLAKARKDADVRPEYQLTKN